MQGVRKTISGIKYQHLNQIKIGIFDSMNSELLLNLEPIQLNDDDINNISIENGISEDEKWVLEKLNFVIGNTPDQYWQSLRVRRIQVCSMFLSRMFAW